ncbi:MAG: NarK/NasA family nitrate transporter [Deltaproteobacteria bacterium]|nr:NarK/NasA family nitrate transporter [Deltaproteobacteria bacterium]
MRRADIKDFFKAGHLGTLISAFLYFDVSFMVWVMIGSLGVYISEDFSLSPAQKGLVVAVPILAGSLLRIPLGIASDYFGPKKTGSVGILLTLFPLLAGWLGGNSLEELFLVGCMLGVAGASFAVALPMVSRWYPPEYQGLAIGIAGAGNSGTVLASFFAPRLAEHMGWHGVFAIAVVPVLLTLALFLFLAKESPRQPSPQSLVHYLRVLKEPDTWWFNLFYMVTFGGFVGLASFLAIFFHDQYGLSRVMAGNFAALCVFAGSFVRPIGGLLADRFGGVKCLLALYGVVASFMFFVGQLPPLPWATVSLFLGMGALGMGNGAVFQLVPQRFQKEIGVVTGVVGAAGGLGGFFLPSLLGLFKDLTGSYGTGFIAFSMVASCCVGLLAYVHRDWRRHWAREEMGVSL